MGYLASFLTTLWLTSTAAQLGFIQDLTKEVTKRIQNEVQAVVDPLEKTVAYIGSSHCKHVKKLLGVTYDNYAYSGPDLSKLTLVFTTRAKTVTYNLTLAPEEIPKERWFNPALPFRIFLHGFTDDPSKSSYQTISSAFLKQDDVNILALDASSLIRWFYLRSTVMVQFIGERLGSVLAALVPAGLEASKIHLIGHSLGSHIAGFTAKTFYNQTGQRVGRISSLDPAGPCFSNLEVDLRLSKEDANFVDVIHTDAGVFGLNEAIGHVDFYPNGGSEQPNCLFPTCSHSRAWLLYAESVLLPESFVGAQCLSWKQFMKGNCDFKDTSVMGYYCPTDSRGKYDLQTSDESPFGLKEAGLTYANNASIIKNIQNLVMAWTGLDLPSYHPDQIHD
ncbi:pancreatic triacylglycerol lipase-like [Spodoptera frugiperda]|uniref:Pancreatic triacylglycerol lipase-like n=1 Tax=Spodoptera frugiperda TaxID=7108 RepID=A0A9R0DR75_SPOFR|nr:pancreatic triacylglycerol lipase-like [Spodoptera frugiperda]